MAYNKLNPMSKMLIFRNSALVQRKEIFQRILFGETNKKIICTSTSEFQSRRNYSVVSCKHTGYRSSHIRKSHLVSIASFLSTNIDPDKYHVVVTDPSSTITSTNQFSSDISSDLSSVTDAASVLPTPDIAVTMGTELAQSAQFLEPTLASLGLCNSTPVGLVQMFLEYLHVSCSMPWWVAIVASTITARILLLPLLIKTQKNAIGMSNHMPQLQYLQAKFGEARKSGNSMEASRYANEVLSFMKEHKISPVKNALLPMLQAPVFISFFLALRGMAKTPVHSMEFGGIWWVTDLTLPDPYYILPIMSCATLYVVLKIGAESGVRMENLKLAKYALQALPLIALPFCINFPAAILYYWVTTNFCTLGIVSILKIKPVRQYLKLPEQIPTDPKYQMPKKGFVSSVKEAYEDQKVLGAVEDRRRMDDVRFRQAGTGPVPRTYSYNPTKTRPSAAAQAAAAKRNT